MLRFLILSLSLVGLDHSARAQETSRFLPVPGVVRDAGTYHLASGTWTRAGSYGLLGSDALFRNDRPSGYWGIQDETHTYFDEGRLPGDGEVLVPGEPEVGTSDAYTITGFEFGYCAMDPQQSVTCRVTFLEQWEPCTNPDNYPVAASFELTGLPNGACWTMALDLSGTTAEFLLVAEGGDGVWDNDDALDNLGWSIDVDHGQGDGGQTAGVLLVGDNTIPGDAGNGTVFKNPGSLGTGLGSRDLFWLHRTQLDYPTGCHWFGGCSPCANFHMVLYGEQVDLPREPCAGSTNSVSGAGAVLASTGGYGTATASFLVTDIPNQPGIFFTGSEETDLPFGCGRRCITGMGIQRYGPYMPGANQLATAIDMAATGHTLVQYWYRDPVYAATCGQPFNLSNALTE